MTRSRLLLLFTISLGLLLFVAQFQDSPGYMDADYHFYMGQRLAGGKGFTELVLWNYLDDPSELPHPSHAYWPPLPSLLSALGVKLLAGWNEFTAARLTFLFLAAAISPLTAQLAYILTKERRIATLAGLLALLPAFYMPYLTTTDSFTPAMFLGVSFFSLLTLTDNGKRSIFPLLGLGAVVGLLQLTRAEGVLWLAIALLALISSYRSAHSQNGLLSKLLPFFTIYVLVAGPWMLRNITIFESPFGPGASSTLWLTSYDDLFAFPAAQLNLAHWLNSGWLEIARARVWALGQNSITGIAVQGQVFLTPLVLIAFWKKRKSPIIRDGGVAWLILFIAMSLIFPFSGVRGGFFHAGAVLQPMIWILAAIGLDDFVDWGALRRGWETDKARKIFGSAILIFAALLSLYVLSQRVTGARIREPVWNESNRHYLDLNDSLTEIGVGSEETIMVNNPPGFALASSLAAIAIPNGDLETSIAAANKYGATFIVIELNHPEGLNDLYESPDVDEDVELIASVDGSHIFRIIEPGMASP